MVQSPTVRTIVAVIGLLGACGGQYRGGSTAPATPSHPAAVEPAPEVRGVEAAALPYAIVDARSGRAVAEADFWIALRGARAVCAGEDHPDPHHHWAQLAIVRHLSDGSAGPATPRALGFEMLQTPFQGAVTDYQGKIIDEAALLSRTGWSDRWGYDFALYRPMFERARDAGWTLLALNAPRELVKRVSRAGLAKLTAAERAQLPDLVLDDAKHKAWFEGIMAGMGDHGHAHAPAAPGAAPPPAMPTPENLYAAQVLWDEAMADGARRWLGLERSGAIVILAGNGHCHDSAIVGRLLRRGVTGVVSVRPVIDDGEGNVAAALLERNHDYLFVMTRPTAP